MAYLGSEPFITVSSVWFPPPHQITHNVLSLLEERHQNKLVQVVQSCVHAPDIFLPSKLPNQRMGQQRGGFGTLEPAASPRTSASPERLSTSYVTRTRGAGAQISNASHSSTQQSPATVLSTSGSILMSTSAVDEFGLTGDAEEDLEAETFANDLRGSGRTLTFDDADSELDQVSHIQEEEDHEAEANTSAYPSSLDHHEEASEARADDEDEDDELAMAIALSRAEAAASSTTLSTLTPNPNMNEPHEEELITDEGEVVMEGYQVGAVYELADGFYIVGEDGQLHKATPEQEEEIQRQMEGLAQEEE